MITIGDERTSQVYTGLAECKVVAINPTLKELSELGINYQKEPEYISVTQNGNKMVRIDIWLNVIKLNKLVKASFFLADEVNVSSSGKTQYIDDYGNSCFVETKSDAEAYQWIDMKTLKPARVGQVKLINFFKAWLKVPKGSIAKIDDINKLLNNNMSEIRQYIELAKDYKVVVLLINRNGYQDVWTEVFGRTLGSSNLFKNQLSRITNPPDYQNDFNLKEYVQPISVGTSSEEHEETFEDPDSSKNTW